MIYLSKIKCVPRLLKLKAAKWSATDIWKCHVSIVKLRKTVEFQFNFRPRFLHFWASGIHMFLLQHILARHPLLRERIAEHQSYFLMIWFLAVTFLVIMPQKSSFQSKGAVLCYVKHTGPSSILNFFRAFPTSFTATSTMGNLCGLVSLTLNTVVAHSGRSYWHSSEITSYLNFPRCLISKSFQDCRAIDFRLWSLRLWW